MNSKSFSLLVLFATSFTIADAAVKSIDKAAAPENSIVRAAGKKLSNLSACFNVVNLETNEDSCIDLQVGVNPKKTRASITMPFVEKDTKGTLVITSGKKAEVQSFYMLVLDNLRSTIVPQSNDVSLAENLGDGLVNAVQGEKGEQGETGPGGAPGPQGAQGPAGPAGKDGLDGKDGPQGNAGLACWDLNANGTGDDLNGAAGDEDLNNDDTVDVLDCKTGFAGPKGDRGAIGPQGPVGPRGPNGLNGTPGPKGDKGDAGLACWDLNGNGTGDDLNGAAGDEDLNNDDTVDVADCKGATGAAGADGLNAGGSISGIIDGCTGYQGYAVQVVGGSGYSSIADDATATDRSFTINYVTPGTYKVQVTQFGVEAAISADQVVTVGNTTDAGTITITDCGN
jgi:hypothetical protein